MPELFCRLPRNLGNIFSRRNLRWHALAIGLTVAIVMSDSDWAYYLATRGELIARLARPAIVLGSMLPILGTLLLLTEVARVRFPVGSPFNLHK